MRNFKPTDNWGNLKKINPLLVNALDYFADLLKKKVWLSPEKGAVYAENGCSHDSEHHLGDAAHVFVETSLLHAFIAATRVRYFGGIGVYPFWSWHARGLKGGLHLDVRYWGLNYPRLMWFEDEKGLHYINDNIGLEALRLCIKKIA